MSSGTSPASGTFAGPRPRAGGGAASGAAREGATTCAVGTMTLAGAGTAIPGAGDLLASPPPSSPLRPLTASPGLPGTWIDPTVPEADLITPPKPRDPLNSPAVDEGPVPRAQPLDVDVLPAPREPALQTRHIDVREYPRLRVVTRDDLASHQDHVLVEDHRVSARGILALVDRSPKAPSAALSGAWWSCFGGARKKARQTIGRK